MGLLVPYGTIVAIACSLIGTMLGDTFSVAETRLPHDDVTPGYLANQYQKSSNYWARIDLIGIDGNITTSPPDRVRFDRRAAAFINSGFDLAFPRFGWRLNVKGWGGLAKEEEKDPPKSPIVRDFAVLEPSLDLTYLNPQGLEIFAGIMMHIQSSYTETLTNDIVSLSSEFDKVMVPVQRFGMVRRGGNWSGGFYYVSGNEGTRGVTKTASDGSFFRSDSIVHIPTEYGIIADFEVSSVNVLLDMAAVQAGESGERSAEGVTVEDDFQRIKIAGKYDLGGGAIGGLSVGYRTFSYSSNAFMSIDRIPLVTYKLTLANGLKSGQEIGLLYANGQDGLSIPETNEEYKVQALGLTYSTLIQK